MDEQTDILLQKFMDKIWPEYSSQLYSDLYRTYHPSTYVEGYTNPKGNFDLALDTIGEAVQKGKKYGLLDNRLIVGRTDYSSHPFVPLPGLGIQEGDGLNLRWIQSVLLFDRLYDIVEEFRCYCGENGVDPDCKGKCMGEFPYLYEDYNKLHNYMMELKNAGAPLDIMLTRSDALNKISLSPERDYITTEHPHAGGMFEQVDKFLSRRLSVIRENIYNLSDGELLGESEQHQLENQMSELFNIHKHEASEHLFKWSIKDVIKEHDMMMSPQEIKKIETRKHLFDALDENFGLFPHPEGELEYEGQPMAVFSLALQEFVPFDALYVPISEMIGAGVEQTDVEMLIEIITDWVNYRMTEKPEVFNESKMSSIDLKKKQGEYNQEYLEILSRFPEELQREIIDERPKGDHLDIEELKGWKLNNPNPIEISLSDLIKKESTKGSVSRTNQEVVDIINQNWNTSIKLAKKLYDSNPERYMKDAEQFDGSTAPPSIMVNGDVIWGVGRMVAALIRPDKTIKVWDIKDSKTITESNKAELNPELEEGDKIIVVNKKDIQSGYREYMGGQEPDLYERYIVFEKRYSGHKAKHSYHYFLVPDIPKYSNRKLGDSTDMSIEDHKDIKALFPWINEWIRAKDRKSVNPELAVGDIVRVVDVDGVHAHAPSVGEKYKVINTRDASSDEYYDVIPYPETSLPDSGYMQHHLDTYGHPDRKTLYRGDTWVLVKDKLNEELDERAYQNPDLKPGDIVIPIDVDRSYGTMHTPDMYKRYEVISRLQIEDGGEIYYYEIEPVDLSDDDRLSGMLVGGGRRRNERLYPDHDLYKLDKEQKEISYLDKLEGMEMEYDPKKANTGGVQEFSWVDEETGTSTDTLLFDIDFIHTAPLLTYGRDNDEPEKNELVKFSLILKGDKSGLFNDWFDLDDRETRKKLIDYFNLGTRKSILLNYFYDNYLKLYGIQKEYLRLENVLIPDSNGIIHNVSGGRQLSEDILDTFKVISKLNKIIKVN